VQRHLSAFKPAAARITATRLLTFVAGTRGFAKLGTHAAADAHFALARAAGGCKFDSVKERRAFAAGFAGLC